ncbi:DNA topoisomerase 2 [Talaromyces islandicus]|uniref:DNA topoisomerase 2 n=1 Tax=Talaromyces islandicus TaxID=28573 RepID=A0A0U1M129_TALIS|nr:DNA topoisomerase 2 [Talaromyces islandicus]
MGTLTNADARIQPYFIAPADYKCIAFTSSRFSRNPTATIHLQPTCTFHQGPFRHALSTQIVRRMLRWEEKTPESGGSSSLENQLANTAAPAALGNWNRDMAFSSDFDDTRLMVELFKPSIPNMLGELGELQPVFGNTRSWTWVIEELKTYPRDFALRAENVFIHKNLVRHPGSGPLRAAFGVCAACMCRTEANELMMFDTLNAEMSKLAKSGMRNNSLEESLSTFQAIVLYQIIRLLYGDSKQRTLAERQKSYIAAWGLQLLQRVGDELQDAQPAWETWLLTESVRRTVLVAFIVHSVYAIFKHGVCPEMPTLSVLPLSSKQAFWSSQTAYLNHFSEDETMKYPEFTSLWTILSGIQKVNMPVTELVFPSYKLDPQSLAGLKEKQGQMFQAFSGVPGLEKTYRGVILEEDGASVDAASMRNVLVLEWDKSASFHDFFPKSVKFEEFVKTIQPFAASPAIPELYEAGTRSVACASSKITQIIKVKSNETTEQSWKQLENFVRKSSAETPSFYSANGIEKDKGSFLGLVGWKGLQEYETFGK